MFHSSGSRTALERPSPPTRADRAREQQRAAVESPDVWAFGKAATNDDGRRWFRSEVSRIRSGEPDDGRQREDGIDQARSASRGGEGDRFVPSSSPRPRRGPVTRRGGASLRAKQAAQRP